MKRLALVAAVLVLAACSKKDESATADTAAPAMAPAPAAVDTTMKMSDTTAGATKDTVTKTTVTKKTTKTPVKKK
jgi:uncharacterized lipoprotein YajG